MELRLALKWGPGGECDEAARLRRGVLALDGRDEEMVKLVTVTLVLILGSDPRCCALTALQVASTQLRYVFLFDNSVDVASVTSSELNEFENKLQSYYIVLLRRRSAEPH